MVAPEPARKPKPATITVFRDRSGAQRILLILGCAFMIQGLATATWFATTDDAEFGLRVVAIGISLFLAWVGFWFAGHAWRRLGDRENPIVVGPAGLYDRALSERPIAWGDIRNLHVWTGKGGPVVVFDLAEGAEDRAGIHSRVRFSTRFNRPFGYSYRVHSMGTQASDIDRLVAAIAPYAEVKYR